MTAQQKNIPALRFPEFEGNWQVLPLNDVAEINPRNGEIPASFIYIDLESVDKGILQKEQVISRENAPSRAQRILQVDDILFQMVRPYQMNNYHFTRKGIYVASTGYAQIRAKIESMFLYQYLHFDKFNQNVLIRCTGTSYPAISSNDLAEIEIAFPSDRNEQQKIADFLTAVDERIQQLRRKKELLEQYKKGVMQQLFSQQIRFKDDNGNDYPDWEEKRLGELVNIKSGDSPIKHKLSYKGMLPYLKVEDLNNTSKYQKTSRQYSNDKINVIKSYSVIFPKRGAAILTNKVRINIIPVQLDTNLMALEVLPNQLNAEYLFYFLDYEKLYKIADTSSIPQINNKHINPYIIHLPAYTEQQKIADFLSGIDDKISSLQTEIEQTQLFKKGLLQQMFC